VIRKPHSAKFSAILAAGGWGLLGVACVEGSSREPYWTEAVAAAPTAESYQVPPPPLSEGVFPCSDCHDPELLPPKPERRLLRVAHQEIELRHDEEHRWCLDCHDAEQRDQLRLASGTLVPFEESYRLCGQPRRQVPRLARG
jgi:hypothetical protein